MTEPFRMGQVGRHSIVYGVGLILSKAVAFLMLPVYTRFLSPRDYGVLHLVIMTMEIVSIFGGSWLARGIFRYYHKAEAEDERRAVLSTALVLLASTYVLAAVATISLAPQIAALVIGPQPEHVLTVKLAALSFIFEGIVIVPTSLMQLHNRSVLFVVVNAVKLVLQVIFNSVFIIAFHMGVNGVIAGNLVAGVAVTIWVTTYMIRENGLRVARGPARDLLRFGIPLIGVQIASLVLTFGDRYFLNKLANTAVVGIYGLASQFGMLPVSLGYLPFSRMWDPTRFAIANRPDRDVLYARGFIYMNILLITMTLMIALYTPDFLRIVAQPAFYSAAALVPLILGAYVFGAWTAFLNLGIFFKERTEWFTVANWVGAGVALAGYLLLIPRWLAWGAAIATFVSYFARFVMVHLVSQKLWPVRYRWGPVIRLCALAVAATLVAIMMQPTSILMSLTMRTGLLILYLVGVWLFGILSEGDRAFIRRFIRSPRAAVAVFSGNR